MVNMAGLQRGFFKNCWNAVAKKLPCGLQSSKDGDDESMPKPLHIIIAFFFLVNYELGTGFLGIPFASYQAGILAGIITILICGFIGWCNAIYTLEVMARAEALVTFKITGCKAVPQCAISMKRKFEFCDLSSIFLGWWAKYLCLFIISVFSFFVCLAYGTVASSSWAVNIPFKFANVLQCNSSDFLHQDLPSDIPCRNAYWFCMFLFACIVIPLSMMELKEQVIVQVLWSLLRFFTIIAIIVFCVINLITTGSICSCEHPWNSSSTENDTFNDSDDIVCNITHSFVYVTTKYNFKAWLVSLSVIATAINFHQGIPAMTHPIKEKQHLGRLMHCLLVIIVAMYLMLGVVVPLWWKKCINETCTLTWGPLTHPIFDLSLRIFSYFVMLFPSIDVISIYPLIVMTTVNNIYIVVFGKDSSFARTSCKSYMILLGLKLVVSLLPLLVAMAVSNLVTVLKFAGLTSFFLAYLLPTLLQLRSQWVLKREFSKVDVAHQEMQQSSSQEEVEETSQLMRRQNEPTASLYKTPYSTVFSHWIAAALVGVVELVLFVLALAGTIISTISS